MLSAERGENKRVRAGRDDSVADFLEDLDSHTPRRSTVQSRHRLLISTLTRRASKLALMCTTRAALSPLHCSVACIDATFGSASAVSALLRSLKAEAADPFSRPAPRRRFKVIASAEPAERDTFTMESASRTVAAASPAPRTREIKLLSWIRVAGARGSGLRLARRQFIASLMCLGAERTASQAEPTYRCIYYRQAQYVIFHYAAAGRAERARRARRELREAPCARPLSPLVSLFWRGSSIGKAKQSKATQPAEPQSASVFARTDARIIIESSRRHL